MRMPPSNWHNSTTNTLNESSKCDSSIYGLFAKKFSHNAYRITCIYWPPITLRVISRVI